MAQNENQSTDARPIKPVSSLLSHFEGLKAHTPHIRPGDKSPIPVRASFDLPRPDSPWTSNADPIRIVPQTPGGTQRQDGESPTRSGHKRPMSMHIGSSPQLTNPPAVNIESPKSPPRNFFHRSSSRSPERIDNTPFGKVRELISAHSSRSSSTRPPSPGEDGQESPKGNRAGHVIPAATPTVGRSISPKRPPPPPVSRAEKPKIPAKPLKVNQPTQITGRLTPETVSVGGTGARISPFSTPPSSEGTPSPEEQISPSFPFDPRESSKDNGFQSRDPRHMGFNATVLPARANTVGERKIMREPGPPKRHVSEQVHPQPPPPPPTRDARNFGFANSTIREVREEPSTKEHVPTQQTTTLARDARQYGFSNKVEKVSEPQSVSISTREPRHFGISNHVEHREPITQPIMPPHPPPPISTRDARQFGFSNTSTPVREERPELPTRKTIAAPPPRPSEESKNLPPKRQPPQHNQTERPRQASVPNIPKAVVPAPGDMNFPPPPKRHTFNDEGTVTPPSTMSRANSIVPATQAYADDSDEAENLQEPSALRTDYPDATQTNRRPPYNMSGSYEIKSRSDGRVFDICGKYLCVSGYVTRVFDMSTGEQILGINHGETVKISSAKFKPGARISEEGTRLWLGSNIGDLQEIDIETQSTLTTSSSHNRRDIIKILRHHRNLWTLDDDGKLFVWHADETGVPNLKYSHAAHKTPRGHTFSMVIHDKLWLATGKEVRIYKPGNEASFAALTSPLAQPNAGDVTSGTYSSERGGRAYLGHTDGKVSIYSTTDYRCLGVVKASDYKINGLAFVGDRLWAAYKTGKVYVYDTSSTPWKVKKDWHAHTAPVSGMILDPSSVWTLSRLQVVTAGHDDVVRLWDATLEEDWMEAAMQERDVEYCTFREVRAAVVTWNVGAAVPSMLRNDFLADAIHAQNPPEILAFGFQEVVDLEDKAITAKSILGFAKKKDTAKTEQHQSRVYREWRDYLLRCIDRFTDAQYSYSEIQTSSLIGLFQCVFIRQGERRNVSNLASINVKCGMGGHYGNKGALVTRFVLDDSSLCFVNCHLAAGQSQTSHRNNDVATILESESLPVELDRLRRGSLFVGGGDGTQILDHEICILNGDLNYRIDTVPRDTVIKMIRNNELPKLLERDQLLVCRRRIAGFRLAPFSELPITFAPTYKYDVGTDNYDSSEKKRAPAWCDRLLYRGPGRIKQIEYRRHEIKVSDHRPVSGVFKIRIKKVDDLKQDRVRQECFKQFQNMKKQICENVCIRWLVEVMGVPEGEARRLIAG